MVITITGIYKIENLATNEWYVGKSINIQRRLKDHFKRTFHESDGWTASVLEECEFEVLNERERFHIANEKLNGGTSKNKTTGGSNGTRYSDESKKKMSDSLRKPEIRAKIIASRKITNDLPGAKEKRSAAAKEVMGRTDVKAKHSAAMKVALSTPEFKAKRSELSKVANAKSETQVKRRASLLVVMNSPAMKSKRQEIIGKQIAGMKVTNARPETTANRRAGMTNLETKAKHSASLKAAHARRREEKEKLLTYPK